MPRRKRGPLTVAVTGASGYIGNRLVEAIAADDRVERVLGFDVRPLTVTPEKVVFDEIDVRNPALGSRFEGVDVVVHLAFVMDPIKDEAVMRDINVHGSHNVFWSAGKAGVGKIVYTSSATVYGAHPDNDMPLTEESSLRANLDFSYPAHKLEVEYVVKEFREEFPKTTVTLLRPAIVFGPNVDNAWSHFLELPVLFGVRGHKPPWQFVHEDDVVEALRFAVLDADLDGPYNLASKGWVTSDELLGVLGRQRVEMSEPAAFALVEGLWELGLGEAPAGMLHYVMHPWVMTVDKLAAAGFECRYSNMEAFAAVAERTRGYVRLGTRRVRRASLARGAAATLGLVSAAAAIRTARRRSA